MFQVTWLTLKSRNIYMYVKQKDYHGEIISSNSRKIVFAWYSCFKLKTIAIIIHPMLISRDQIGQFSSDIIYLVPHVSFMWSSDWSIKREPFFNDTQFYQGYRREADIKKRLRATRLSNKLLEQGYVKERLKSSLRKFYGRYGDLIKQYEVSLSQMLNDILWPDHIQWQPPTDQTLYRTRPFTEFRVVSIEHLRRVWHADRGRLLLRTPGPVLFRTCIFSTCRDQRHPVSIRHYTSLWHYYRTWHFYWIWHFTRYCFP